MNTGPVYALTVIVHLKREVLAACLISNLYQDPLFPSRDEANTDVREISRRQTLALTELIADHATPLQAYTNIWKPVKVRWFSIAYYCVLHISLSNVWFFLRYLFLFLISS